MIDSLLLRGLRNGNENALSHVIDKYTSYVCTIIRNSVGQSLSHEDIEEVASDVFLALWDNAEKVDKLKPYMSAIARNKAKNKLRLMSDVLPLEDELLADDSETLDEILISKNQREIIKSAVLNMEETDRDIFLRYYYDTQTVPEIADEINISQAAVKQRLSRGRKKLKLMIKKENFAL